MTGSEGIKSQLTPGMMKGPNAPLPMVDLLMNEVKPKDWNNIPVPLVEAI